MFRAIMITAITLLLLALPSDAFGHTLEADPNARVQGCEYEDSCTIDYRGSAKGGVWIIRPYAQGSPATLDHRVKVYGCTHEDTCAIDYTHRGVWTITQR